MSQAGFPPGRRVLIVEDEALISMLIETILEDAGFVPVVAHSIADALAAIAQCAPDAAILDVNLKGEKVFPVADRLYADGVPFIFMTGGGGAEVDGYLSAPRVPKPFQEGELVSSLTQALA
jgi:DNA-binding response OmpR family regulator